MTVADIVVLGILLLSSVIALRLGVVRVVLGLLGWAGATLTTIYAFPYARPYALEWIGNEIIGAISAGAAIFVVSMVVLTFISHAISGGVRDSSFGMLDRSFGLLAGLVIGATAVSGGFIFSQQVLDITERSSFYEGSKTLPLVKRGASILAAAAPNRWDLSVPSAPKTNRGKQFRSLMAPKPETEGAQRDSGYRPIERQEMDRLIRNHQ